MRFNIKKSIMTGISAAALLPVSSLLQSCDGAEAGKWVDLRYRVEDSYLVEAKNPEPVSFRVKSTDPWKVFGKYDWHTISPDTGEAGETYTVTVTCKENTELDDRIDTLNIKSDYWTGKQFTLTQKGTAYLGVEGVDIINREGGGETFSVLSNQKWTAKVTGGNVWLSIQSAASGELNGEITVTASPNTGEQRTGIVTIYDRHGKTAEEVQCVQGGVLLTPDTPENGKWFAMYEQARQLTIHVESNAEWEVSKENEADDTWYHFEETSFHGSADIVINVDMHEGSAVRTGTIVLSTKAAEGATPLLKTIRIKQANPQRPVATEVNKSISDTYYGPAGLMPGHYSFYWEPLGDANLNTFFSWKGKAPDGGDVELRFHILGKRTQLSTRPWNGDVYNENSGRDVDTAKPNVLSFEIREAVDTNDPAQSWIYSEWILNDKVIGKATSDGVTDANGTGDTYKVPFSVAKEGGNFSIKISGGSATLAKWEYIAPLVWGD